VGRLAEYTMEKIIWVIILLLTSEHSFRKVLAEVIHSVWCRKREYSYSLACLIRVTIRGPLSYNPVGPIRLFRIRNTKDTEYC